MADNAAATRIIVGGFTAPMFPVSISPNNIFAMEAIDANPGHLATDSQTGIGLSSKEGIVGMVSIYAIVYDGHHLI